MVRLRKQGQREAGRLWRQVKADDLDGTFPLGQLELTVSTLQREAARLSSAYLSTFIASELGEPERPPALSVWDKAFGGGDLREALRSAVIKTKQAIGEGDDPREATNRNRIVLVNDVGLFIDTAARESLRQGMEQDDRIVGYQRALKGTCGACAGNVAVETTVELPSIPLRIHPNCQCVTEPVMTPRSKAQTLNKEALVQVPSDLAEKNIYQWLQADQRRAYGMDFADFGDAVPGGYNYRMFARNEAGETMGRLEVNMSGNDGVIAMIEVEEKFRRQGVAKKLLDYMRRYEPDLKLEWGYMTPDGQALRNSLPKAWQ
jgi:GNAT superfamily N-acetyltransferase